MGGKKAHGGKNLGGGGTWWKFSKHKDNLIVVFMPKNEADGDHYYGDLMAETSDESSEMMRTQG